MYYKCFNYEKYIFCNSWCFYFFLVKKEEFELYYNTWKKLILIQQNWRDNYTDGGTLTVTNTNAKNVINGTKWVLKKYVTAFASESPNDTILFISNTKYTLNGGANRSYLLSKLPSSTNYDLQLDYFMPFGSSMYAGQLGYYFVDDGEMNNILFTDLMNKNITIKAWFVRIY